LAARAVEHDMSMPALVDVAWLASALGSPGLCVLDASFYLPTEHKNAREEFEIAHIPGARFFDIEDIADTESDLPHMLPASGRFARKVAALGIGNGDRVVVYDQKGIFSAPRAWWMFAHFGHAAVAVLDGGLPAWRAAGQSVKAGWPGDATPAQYVARHYATQVRGLGDMLHNLETGAELVIDARPAGRFAGTAPEPRPGLPSGHIPGAVNLPASDLVVDGRMRPAAALRAAFAAVGADGNRPVVTSCGSGVSACVLSLGLHLAGLPEGAVYDGSWTEWASLRDTPKAVGSG
jgi:thiosulfate/3-mercaptopyruvate sulfurtransferase